MSSWTWKVSCGIANTIISIIFGWWIIAESPFDCIPVIWTRLFAFFNSSPISPMTMYWVKKKQRNEHVVIHFPDFLHDQSFYCIFSKFQMIVYRKTNVHKILVNNRGNKDLANKSFLVTWTWLRITSFDGIITYTNTRYTTIQRRWRITFTVSRSFAETTSARTFGKLCPSTPITIDWNQTSIYDNIDPLARIYISHFNSTWNSVWHFAMSKKLQ